MPISVSIYVQPFALFSLYVKNSAKLAISFFPLYRSLSGHFPFLFGEAFRRFPLHDLFVKCRCGRVHFFFLLTISFFPFTVCLCVLVAKWRRRRQKMSNCGGKRSETNTRVRLCALIFVLNSIRCGPFGLLSPFSLTVIND